MRIGVALLALMVAFCLSTGPKMVLAGDDTKQEVKKDGDKEVKDGADLVKKGAEQIVEGGTATATSFLNSIPWYATPIGFVVGFLIGLVIGKKKPSNHGKK